jgi:hypothetical protein
MIWPNTVKKTLVVLANAFGITTTGKSAATLAGNIAAAAAGGEEADAAALAALTAHEEATDPHPGVLYTQAEVDALLAAMPLPPVAVSFTAEASADVNIHEAMTLDLVTTYSNGAGTISFSKALAASKTTFNAASGSTTFAAGDVLRVSATDACAVTIPRTA